MGRFDLSKGDRFDLKKSEGLSKLEVVLGWASGADLDASAFLLGNDGLIGDDADFVFYGSKNREKPFSRDEHGNQNNHQGIDDISCDTHSPLEHGSHRSQKAPVYSPCSLHKYIDNDSCQQHYRNGGTKIDQTI